MFISLRLCEPQYLLLSEFISLCKWKQALPENKISKSQFYHHEQS
jgi:hypothetical protein